jgi:hypothetical protein
VLRAAEQLQVGRPAELQITLHVEEFLEGDCTGKKREPGHDFLDVCSRFEMRMQ